MDRIVTTGEAQNVSPAEIKQHVHTNVFKSETDEIPKRNTGEIRETLVNEMTFYDKYLWPSIHICDYSSN
jgi:hypothetical protein